MTADRHSAAAAAVPAVAVPAAAAPRRRHAVARRRRHRVPLAAAGVVRAVDERDVVLVEAERAAHESVETEHVARQLQHAREFSATSARASAPDAIISCHSLPRRPTHGHDAAGQ